LSAQVPLPVIAFPGRQQSNLRFFPRRERGAARVYRTIFLSDVHLGCFGSRAESLAELLEHLDCDKLYLVGDIIDMWQLRRRWRWTEACNAVIGRLLEIAKSAEVIFVPGNHDDAARRYAGLEVAGVSIRLRDVHCTADGRRLLVTHGDQYDLVVRHSPSLFWLGDQAYEVLLRINEVYNGLRAWCGLSYWSLAQFVKLRVKSAFKFIQRFEETLVHEASREGLDGVVCGHIHKSELRRGRVNYLNCGDWIESCTLIVEHQDGQLELLDGLQLLAEIKAETQADARATA
jgi:UDP-2,3-diacylglucosamine pyrophosphatase LpxH